MATTKRNFLYREKHLFCSLQRVFSISNGRGKPLEICRDVDRLFLFNPAALLQHPLPNGDDLYNRSVVKVIVSFPSNVRMYPLDSEYACMASLTPAISRSRVCALAMFKVT